MFDLILSLVVFFIVLISRFSIYFINKKSKKKHKLGSYIDIMYLVKKFNLDNKKMNTSLISFIVSFIDAFIISITLWISVNITDSIILELLIGLVIVLSLIYIINEILGRILLKRGYEKK